MYKKFGWQLKIVLFYIPVYNSLYLLGVINFLFYTLQCNKPVRMLTNN